MIKNKDILLNCYDNPHLFGHYLGYEKLNQTHSEWIKHLFFSSSEIPLQAHRNSYKTTSLVVGIILYLIFNPNATFCIIRKSESGAIKILQEVAGHYEKKKLKCFYKEVLGIDLPVIKYNQRQFNHPLRDSIGKEYTLEAFGKGANITGSHFDFVILDDIITDRDRYSRAERESTKQYVMETVNIKTLTGKRIITGTPWHPDDAFSILPDAIKYPLGAIDIPEMTQEKIDYIRKSMSSSLFVANYYLKHIASENREFDEPKYEKWDVKKYKTINAFIDPAYSGTNTTAITFLGKYDNKAVVKGYVWRKNIINVLDIIQKECIINNTGTVYIETNGDKGFSKIELDKRGLITKGVNETQNKHSKIIGNIKSNWDYIYFADDIQEEYLSQILDYEEGQEPDDAPDSLASLIRQIGIVDRDFEVVIKKESSIEDYIKGGYR